MAIAHAFLIEDDDVVRASLGKLLRVIGVPSTGFPSAESFLASYRGDERGCLIVDIRMPGMSGLDLIDTLQQRGTTLPAIVISGHADEGSLHRLAGMRFVGLLEKPFSLAQLREMLERCEA